MERDRDMNEDRTHLNPAAARQLSRRKSRTSILMNQNEGEGEATEAQPGVGVGKLSLSFAGNGDEDGNGNDAGLVIQVTDEEVRRDKNVDIDVASIGEQSIGAKSGRSARSANSRKSKGEASAGGDSVGSSNSSTTGGRGKSIADTAVRKLIYMQGAFLALALHVLYLAGVLLLGSTDGMVLPFNATVFVNAGPIIAIVWARAAYLVTDNAMNEAFGAFVGYLLSRKEGFSIAACGFIHSSFREKITFSNRLSFRSTAKPLLSKISLFWIAHFLNLILSMLAASSVSAASSQVDSNSLMCITYTQDTMAFDRGLPTIYNEMGGAQYIDGTAFGLLRVSDPTLPYTTHAIPPQLIDVCLDGSTIKGYGYTTDVSTQCTCANGVDSSSLVIAGIPSSISSAMSASAVSLQNFPGWVNSVVYDESRNVSTIYTILVGGQTCGGYVAPASGNVTASTVTSSAPVCISEVSNHTNALIRVAYKTDGTPASIAAKKVDILESYDPADNYYLHESILTLLVINPTTNVSSQHLPAHWPGSVNPLLWFSSDNMQDVSLALLEPGMEATIALVIRASIQRSYAVSGGACTQQVFDPASVTLRMQTFGYVCALIWVIIQLAINLFVFALYIPWWLQKSPILPAIDAAQQHIIFSLLSSKNVATNSRMKTMSSNLESGLLWPRLDLVLRIGESVPSVDDPERGIIMMDKPKFVTSLSYDKTYV